MVLFPRRTSQRPIGVVSADAGAQKGKVCGSLLFKEGNKVQLNYTGDAGGGRGRDNWVVSDGSQIRIMKENAFVNSPQWKTPKTLLSDLTTCLMRHRVLDIYSAPYRLQYRHWDPKETIREFDFKFDEKDREHSALPSRAPPQRNSESEAGYSVLDPGELQRWSSEPRFDRGAGAYQSVHRPVVRRRASANRILAKIRAGETRYDRLWWDKD